MPSVPVSLDELKQFALQDAVTLEQGFPTRTKYGSSSYVSIVRSRSAKFTRSKVDNQWLESDYQLVQDVQKYLSEHEMIQVDRLLGERDAYQRLCRLLISKEYARIAEGWSELFIETSEPIGEPDFITYYIPEWEERAILVDGEEGVTYVLGTDYTGEAKKSFLRQDMYKVKKEGGLGLHAGSKTVTIKDGEGNLRTLGQLYFGLSATGKSTLTSHGFWLENPEHAELVQDDVVRWLPDGSILGTEGKGLYVKTDGLNAEDQPEIYNATISADAVLENVWVNPDGSLDFDNVSLTKNGRAIILRKDLPNISESIDIDRVDQIFFITRNPMMPPIGKLSPEQAACAFMLGESVESSAGDPTKAGQAVRVVGTNPFIVGPKGEEGNRFLELLRAQPHVECFILNTGGVGSPENHKNISLKDTVHFLSRAARSTVEWVLDADFGFALPKTVVGSEFDPRQRYEAETFQLFLAQLKHERIQWLDQFPELFPEIRKAVY
ncbi:MAG: phosphoenolpyruvate carboxykinase (ATP) [bacterium]